MDLNTFIINIKSEFSEISELLINSLERYSIDELELHDIRYICNIYFNVNKWYDKVTSATFIDYSHYHPSLFSDSYYGNKDKLHLPIDKVTVSLQLLHSNVNLDLFPYDLFEDAVLDITSKYNFINGYYKNKYLITFEKWIQV